MGSKWANRQALGRVDDNQQDIIDGLTRLPGVSVATKHDDILVGYRMFNYWFELKKEEAISKRTGILLESAKTKQQKALDRTWTGQRNYATTVDEILDIIGYS